MKKIIIIIMLLNVLSVYLYAQVTIGGIGVNNVSGGSFGNTSYVRSVENKDGVTITHYAEQENTELKAIYLSKFFYQGVLKADSLVDSTSFYRYNITTDQIEIMVGKNQIKAITKPLKTNYLSFGGKTFVYALSEKNNEITAGYYELLTDGKAQLLLKRYGKSRTDNYLAKYSGGGGTGKEIHVVGKSIYYQINNQGAIKLKSSRSQYKRMFADKQTEILSFLKSENIDLKTIDGKINLFKYYNSLF